MSAKGRKRTEAANICNGWKADVVALRAEERNPGWFALLT